MFFSNWIIFWRNKKLRSEFLITLILLVSVLFLLSKFLNYIEQRTGIVLDDPILKLYQPVDVTWFTFIFIYGGLILAIVYLSGYPEKLTFAIQVYIIMVMFRIIAMYVVPLNAPPSMIMLKDPLVEYIGTGRQLNKDLFFSGHTATMFLLYLTSEKMIIKILFLCLTIIIALCVLVQHVHYTIDVLAAPFFTFGSYYLVLKFRKNNPRN